MEKSALSALSAREIKTELASKNKSNISEIAK
jgi:hypothetical protein